LRVLAPPVAKIARVKIPEKEANDKPSCPSYGWIQPIMSVGEVLAYHNPKESALRLLRSRVGFVVIGWFVVWNGTVGVGPRRKKIRAPDSVFCACISFVPFTLLLYTKYTWCFKYLISADAVQWTDYTNYQIPPFPLAYQPDSMPMSQIKLCACQTEHGDMREAFCCWCFYELGMWWSMRGNMHQYPGSMNHNILYLRPMILIWRVMLTTHICSNPLQSAYGGYEPRSRRLSRSMHIPDYLQSTWHSVMYILSYLSLTSFLHNQQSGSDNWLEPECRISCGDHRAWFHWCMVSGADQICRQTRSWKSQFRSLRGLY